MRNKLTLALIFFGVVTVATASVPMPQKANSSLQRSKPYCTCARNINGHLYFGILNRDEDICDLSAECVIPDE